MRPAASRSNHLTVIAQDADVVDRAGAILTSRVTLPPEHLAEGPWGYRVQVIDFDASTNTLYPPLTYAVDENGAAVDPFERPAFHAQNVYAVVMITLARFEKALGRRVSWRFGGTRSRWLRTPLPTPTPSTPGATRRCSSATSREGRPHRSDLPVPRRGRPRDTHALLDGLRERFIDPSSPDQAAFHEGFADVVALLSVFSLPRVVEEILARTSRLAGAPENLIPRDVIDPESLKRVRPPRPGRGDGRGDDGGPWRSPPAVGPPGGLRRAHSTTRSSRPPHRRGELLVAAMMNAFVRVWSDRVKDLGEVAPGYLDLQRVAEEGTGRRRLPADHRHPGAGLHAPGPSRVLRLSERDGHRRPRGSPGRIALPLSRASSRRLPGLWHRFRAGQLRAHDQGPARGIPEHGRAAAGGWSLAACHSLALVYDRTHADSLARDVDEVFRFLWENRGQLKLAEDAYTQVLSVRPALRVGPDGFALRETVAEAYQVLRLHPAELARRWEIKPFPGLEEDDVIPIYGGATLIFDEYGRLKFYIHNSLDSVDRQKRRVEHLLARGALPERGDAAERGVRRGARSGDFSRVHRLRAFDAGDPRQEW